MSKPSKSKRKPGRPSKAGLIKRPPVVTSDELPDVLLDAIDLGMQCGLAAVEDSLRGAPDGRRGMLRRRALALLGYVQDSAILAEASHLASWAEVKDLDQRPSDTPGASLWLAALAIRTLLRLEIGQIVAVEDVEQMNVTIRNATSTIRAAPVKARVEAARKLREDRQIQRERPGPKPRKVKAGKSLRV